MHLVNKIFFKKIIKFIMKMVSLKVANTLCHVVFTFRKSLIFFDLGTRIVGHLSVNGFRWEDWTCFTIHTIGLGIRELKWLEASIFPAKPTLFHPRYNYIKQNKQSKNSATHSLFHSITVKSSTLSKVMFGCMEEEGRKEKKKKDFSCLVKMKMRK